MIVRHFPSPACMGLVVLATLYCQTSMAQTAFPSDARFSITYTFTTSTPASPIDVGAGRDLTVNRYLATTVNDAGGGFLHRVAGRWWEHRYGLSHVARLANPKTFVNPPTLSVH